MWRLSSKRICSSVQFVVLTVLCLSTASAQQAGKAGVKGDFQAFVSSTLSVGTFVTPAVTAAGSQFIFKPAGFGTGINAYGYHYGVSLADTVGGKFFRKFVFPAVSGQPDRYEPTHGKRTLTRILSAAGHGIFVDPLQLRKLNWSGAPASLVSAALSNAYQPSEQQTWSATFQRFGTNSAGYALGDMLCEFSVELSKIPLLGKIVKCG
jgi:hypothetical protein